MEIVLRLLADGTLILLIAVSAPVIVWWLRKDTWSRMPVIIMAGLTSLLIAKISSIFYQPAFARPFLELGLKPGAAYIDNPGFPSDHALLGAVIVIATYVATKNKILCISLTLLLILMGVGRVVALVHTPLDIFAGIAAAILGSIWYCKLTK